MLTIILRILGVIGIILLVLLATALVVLLLVLFVPIRYRISADRKPEGEPPLFQNRLSAKVNWLLGLLRIRYSYPEPGELTVKILFFTIYHSHFREEDTSVLPDEEERYPSSAEESGHEQEPPATEPEHGKDKSKKRLTEETPEETPEETDVKKEQTSEKIGSKVRGICDKIKEIRENVDYYRELFLCDDTRELLNHALMRLGRILKSIRPRRLKADILFGTGSPDTTGYILGVYAVLSPGLGHQIHLSPDFEDAVLEGEVYAAGHVTICKLLWHGLRLLLDKRFRKLVRRLKKKDNG